MNQYWMKTIAATELADLKKVKSWVRENVTVSLLGRFIGRETENLEWDV